jgi:hypothetical protein
MGLEVHGGEVYSLAVHRSKHLIVIRFERASRCYEFVALALDVFP